MSIGQQVFVSQHIGDLETPEAVSTFQHALEDLQSLYEQQAEVIACDLHPDYRSTHLARELAEHFQKPLIQVQHHYAHVLACMAEHQLHAPVLGVAWDGTGYGMDGTIWGGEFLNIHENSFERIAYLRPFCLIGGEHAIREARRIALGLLFELYGTQSPDIPQLGFSSSELDLLKAAFTKRINAPLTSSIGRLFDAVSALIGLRQQVSFEGQAAMELEFACEGITTERSYYPNMVRQEADGKILDWAPMIKGILADLAVGMNRAEIAAAFHNTLIDMIVGVAVKDQIEQIVLSGGCFQNKRLLEGSVTRLQKAGFHPVWSQKIPSNDGGIALGQLMAAQREYVWRSKCV
jgi:hydrogenase maturation protein HypF